MTAARVGRSERERQRALSRTSRPQRDTKRAFGPIPPHDKLLQGQGSVNARCGHKADERAGGASLRSMPASISTSDGRMLTRWPALACALAGLSPRGADKLAPQTAESSFFA